jgi:ABC-type phosphate transport system permease subunit
MEIFFAVVLCNHNIIAIGIGSVHYGLFALFMVIAIMYKQYRTQGNNQQQGYGN